MTLQPAVIFLGGLVVIVVGAELLLRGATRIAAVLGIKPILIGLTVVAVGTSAPELAVGITAVLEGKGPLAVANVAGTTMFNILFILGLSAAIVAIGTSAPELATTVVATIRDDRDVAVGNLIGSSISNVFVILGLTCIAAPGGVDVSRDVLLIDLPLAAAVAIACWPVFRTDRMVSRVEGAVFVACYLAYLTALIAARV